MNADTDQDTTTPGAHGFLGELKRRKVFRVAVTYAIVGWLVIQIAETTFPNLGIPAWAMRLVIMAVLLGFPIALVLAWAFELTPQGLMTSRRAIESGQRQRETERLTRARNRFAIAGAAAIPAVIFAALAVYFYLQVPDPGTMPAAAPGKSIAVLPFENRSNVAEDQYFVEGIHDDLLTQIAHIGDIKTISRTSVMAYRDTTKNLRTIGEELGVATILEGGVQRAGDQIRINVQLIDAASDAHLWAQTYTREMTAENVFRIQSDIAGAIAGALQSVLQPDDIRQLNKLPTENLAALEAFFRGLASHDGTAAGQSNSIQYYRAAIEEDPDFAEAHAALALTYLGQVFWGGLPPAEQAAKARPLVERALELDPDLSIAHVAQGTLRRYLADASGAETAFERAVELNPNDFYARIGYGNLLLWSIGDAARAAEQFRVATELAPEDLGARQQLADALLFTGRVEEAERRYQRLIDEDPGMSLAYFGLARAYGWYLGRYDEALRLTRKAYSLEPGIPQAAWAVGGAYFALGLEDEGRQWMQLGMSRSENPGDAAAMRARLAMSQGDIDAIPALVELVTPGDDLYNMAQATIAYYEYARGDRERALTLYETAFPELAAPAPVLMWRSMEVLPVYISALLATGRQERAELLLRSTREQLADWPRIFSVLQEARMYVALGRLDEARAAMDAFAAEGGCLNLDYQFTSPAVSDDPLFDPVRARMAECIARQQQQVARWEAEGALAAVSDGPI